MAGTLLGTWALVGCVQMPTEKQQVLELRPQISFRLAHESLSGANVRIDGLPMGTAGQFEVGKAALALQPGTHQLVVDFNGNALINERFYVGDGVSKTFDLR
ncbi:hypothetical protein [Diaphorobacter aerolatus]|uniref:PEGA domain-containing protein n=1 Tax=Diaphorobacter aerolatus TaxID=1288495 RepID=A0A7H0GG47_9BURK|nr:hypothetical protein [Diaphorobacter aerolatus]QNP47263.1 hypothetical protein H9K75_12850 [Diaphorobacter aerolatus]